MKRTRQTSDDVSEDSNDKRSLKRSRTGRSRKGDEHLQRNWHSLLTNVDTTKIKNAKWWWWLQAEQAKVLASPTDSSNSSTSIPLDQSPTSRSNQIVHTLPNISTPIPSNSSSSAPPRVSSPVPRVSSPISPRAPSTLSPRTSSPIPPRVASPVPNQIPPRVASPVPNHIPPQSIYPQFSNPQSFTPIPSQSTNSLSYTHHPPQSQPIRTVRSAPPPVYEEPTQTTIVSPPPLMPYPTDFNLCYAPRKTPQIVNNVSMPETETKFPETPLVPAFPDSVEVAKTSSDASKVPGDNGKPPRSKLCDLIEWLKSSDTDPTNVHF